MERPRFEDKIVIVAASLTAGALVPAAIFIAQITPS
jgi:hypothetical protein